MRVKNLNGTSSHSCNCGTWLNHWKNFSGYYRIRPNEEISCSVIGCRNKATDGGHVKKISSGISRTIPRVNDWYIVPLCKQCNQKTDEFDIDDSVSFASANIATTCGRSQTNDDDLTFRRRLPPSNSSVLPEAPGRRLKVIAEKQGIRKFNK